MKSTNINNIQTNIIPQKLNKAVKEVVTKNITTLGIGAAAVSGMYMAQKSSQERKELKSLNLSDETVSKLLNAKTKEGTPVFDKEGIKILIESSKLEDKMFFDHVIKNAGDIYSIKKFDTGEEGHFTYEIKGKIPDGETRATVTTSSNGIKSFVSDRVKLDKVEKIRVVEKDFIIDTIEEKTRGKLASLQETVLDKRNNSITKKVFDPQNIKRVLSETKTIMKDNNVKEDVSIVYDYSDENNVVSKIIVKDDKNSEITITGGDSNNSKVTALTKTYTNPLTQKVETINMEMSSVPGVYNSTIIDEMGNKTIESKADIDDKGNISVEKHFVSLDGIKTDYVYTSDKNKEDIKLNYKITDVDGKTIALFDRTFKRVSPNLAYSSVNGREYVIEKNNDAIVVTDKIQNKKTNIPISDILYEDSDRQYYSEIFDKLSGDMILDFYNRGYKFSHIDDNRRSCMQASEKYIKAKDDIFVFNHEQGHSKDFVSSKDLEWDNTKDEVFNQYRITNQPTVQQAYEQERNEFMKSFSEMEKSYAGYFVDDLGRIDKNAKVGETVAEINGLLSTEPASTHPNFWLRQYQLQKYFPKTIAATSEFLIKD
jgi:hypothetical protein